MSIPAPRSEPTPAEHRQWLDHRARIADRVAQLTAAGICFQCHDQQTGGGVLGAQDVITEDRDVRAVIALDPRVPGHTIVVWKPHVRDFTKLDDSQTTHLFRTCRDVARAIQQAIEGVEHIYQVTMCDGAVNHLHVQLIPRYKGAAIGSARLVDPRGPLIDGPRTARAIRQRDPVTNPVGRSWSARIAVGNRLG